MYNKARATEMRWEEACRGFNSITLPFVITNRLKGRRALSFSTLGLNTLCQHPLAAFSHCRKPSPPSLGEEKRLCHQQLQSHPKRHLLSDGKGQPDEVAAGNSQPCLRGGCAET